MTTLRRLLLFLALSTVLHASGQDTIPMQEAAPPYDSLKLLYPFLHLEKNRITGDTAALRPFFRKLDGIRDGSGEQAVVIHIGDSHIQPGFVTQPLREWLQAGWGNPGRGLLFPYRVAKSNGPPGYISRCDTAWIYSRNASPKKILPTGISGFTIMTDRPGASFTLEFTQPLVQGSDTARLVLYHAARDTNFAFTVTNDLTGRGYAVTDTSSPWKTVFTLDEKPQRIRVRAIRTRDSQHAATLYGMSLESPMPGVRVDVIGVNGAMFSSYLESAHFIVQLADRHPDLLIISLGTNEAYGSKSYSSDTLRQTLDSLFTRIRKAGITSSVILTTPPGIYKAYRKKRRTHYQPNPVVHQVAEVIRDYAQTHGMAVWDWYSVMGGRDAMARWKAKKLTDRKYVHFSGRGYAIQGMLLREALREQMVRSRTGSGR